MTHGISCRDIVLIKGTHIIAKVVGVVDFNDRYPAELLVVYKWGKEINTRKVKADEVTRISNPEIGELTGVINL